LEEEMASRQNVTDLEITREGLTTKVVRFSYQTPVAVELLEPVKRGDWLHPIGIYVTEQYHSPTTTKHVNQFVYHPSRADKGGSVQRVKPEILAALIGPAMDNIHLIQPGSRRG
tara:strand:- start:483 stop:824 length:342 start_codon:yes stop_codon:yes gene_type:complete